jgi:SAM-dependent methyltransferase
MRERDWKDSADAQQWDREHLASNPARAEHLGLLVDYVEHLGLDLLLDLGCGTGVVAEMVLERATGSSVVGLDSSPAMLEIARRRLARFGGRARLLEADLADVSDVSGLGLPGPFDAAVAVQSLHHLAAPALQPLLGWTRTVLKPGGWLLIADRVGVPAPELYPAFHRYKARTGHSRNPSTWDEYLSDLHRGHDLPQPLDGYLALLGAAGFHAGCVECRADRAFIVARAPTRRSR